MGPPSSLVGSVRGFRALVQGGLKIEIAYKMNAIAMFLKSLATVVTLVFVWRSVYEMTGHVGSYDLGSMRTYVVLANIIAPAMFSKVEVQIGADYRMGTVGIYAVRPVPVFGYYMCQSLGRAFARFLIVSLPLSVICLLFIPVLPPHSVAAFLAACAMFLLDVVLLRLADLSVSNLVVRLNSTWGLSLAKTLIYTVLSGTLFPLDILPPELERIARFTPFYYTTNSIVRAYLGEIAGIELLSTFLIIVTWAAVLGMAVWVANRRFSRRLETVGG